MFPHRRLSLPLMILVCSGTALASTYEIDRPDSTLQLSSPYSPPLFAAFVSNFAGHLRLGNQLTSRRSPLVFDLTSLASPKEALDTDTMPTLSDTSCRAPASFNWPGAPENSQSVAEYFGVRSSDTWERVLTATYDVWLSPATGNLPTASRQRLETALVVDESPCLVIPSLHSLLALFRPNHFTPYSIPHLTQRDAFSEYTK
jgi:hypothetical protein